ncbi:MAG: amidohydrolase family protein [Thermoleophilia bacterium]|nr:amidohydrolase family protein [Thermoleophilia bacterium]
MSRLWGEDSDALAQAGVDVASLAQLEDELSSVLVLDDAPIVDAHVHLGRDADGHNLTAHELARDLDRWGIAAAVCFPANDPGPGGQFTEANDLVLAAARSAPERIVPFCRVDPNGDWALELERAAEAGARGLKLHPVGQSFRPEADESVAAVSVATERGWPVLFHAGFGARRLGGPLAELAGAVPDARLILAHGGRGDARALAHEFAGESRIAFDTSLATVTDLAALSPGQLMFGSDRPYGEHASALHLIAATAGVAGWTDAEVRDVLGGNLTRWLDDQG